MGVAQSELLWAWLVVNPAHSPDVGVTVTKLQPLLLQTGVA